MRRFLLLILVLAAAACAFVWLIPTGPHAENFIEIAPGTSSRQIALQLQQKHLIWNRYAFDALRLFKGGTLKAGEYRFRHPARLGEVYSRLERGDVYTISLTVPEGANMFDIAQRVDEAHLGTRAAFLHAATADTALVRDLDPTAVSLEVISFPTPIVFRASPSLTRLWPRWSRASERPR